MGFIVILQLGHFGLCFLVLECLLKQLPDCKLVVLLGDVPNTTNVVIQAVWVYSLKLFNPELFSFYMF